MRIVPVYQGDTSELPVRIRRRLDGELVETIAASVPCPVQAKTVAAEECAACPNFIGWSGSAQEGNLTAHCRTQSPTACTHPTGMQGPQTRVAAVMSRQVTCVAADMLLHDLGPLFVDNRAAG